MRIKKVLLAPVLMAATTLACLGILIFSSVKCLVIRLHVGKHR